MRLIVPIPCGISDYRDFYLTFGCGVSLRWSEFTTIRCEIWLKWSIRKNWFFVSVVFVGANCLLYKLRTTSVDFVLYQWFFFSWFFLEATDSHRIFNKLKTKTNWKKLFLDIYRSKIAGLNQKLIKLSGINKNKQKTRNIVRSITSNSIICCEEVKRMLINKSANIRIISINMRGWNSDTAFWKLITQFRWLLKYVRECQNDKHKML